MRNAARRIDTGDRSTRRSAARRRSWIARIAKVDHLSWSTSLKAEAFSSVEALFKRKRPTRNKPRDTAARKWNMIDKFAAKSRRIARIIRTDSQNGWNNRSEFVYTLRSSSTPCVFSTSRRVHARLSFEERKDARYLRRKRILTSLR